MKESSRLSWVYHYRFSLENLSPSSKYTVMKEFSHLSWVYHYRFSLENLSPSSKYTVMKEFSRLSWVYHYIHKAEQSLQFYNVTGTPHCTGTDQ
jgi:hypothetical protein